MTEELLTMNRTELNRLKTIRRVVSKRLRRKQATCQPAPGTRRTERLVRRYRE